jgi:hypothetical protein
VGEVSVTTIVVGAVVLFVGGGVTGWSLAAKQSAALEVQGEQFAVLQAGQASIVDAASRPVVLDAELRSSLAGTPPACVQVLGGDPLSAQCAMISCWSYGQSGANRPECSTIMKAAIDRLGCPTEGE